ncbi:MAG: hypothetical protein NZO16_06050 [Deltaproteobacteria bacterium]|nr:hypothetical protein [Deltaproteobacteria bacterium]
MLFIKCEQDSRVLCRIAPYLKGSSLYFVTQGIVQTGLRRNLGSMDVGVISLNEAT